MASTGSKGNRKKNSLRQQERYKSHPYKLEKNKKAKLLRHIRKNFKEYLRKAKREDPNDRVALDEQARQHYVNKYGKLPADLVLNT